MYRRVFVLTSSFALVAMCSLGAQTQPACPGPKDVCGLFETFMSALNRRDWEAFRGTFAPDITVIFDRPGPPQRQQGRVAVEAVFQNIFPKPGSPPAPLPPALVPEGVAVQLFRDIAIVSFHLRRPDQLGRRTLVFHRGFGGWKVVHIHGSSSDLPAQ